MFRGWQRNSLASRNDEGTHMELRQAPTAATRVTVLLLMMAMASTVRAEDPNSTDLRVFEFVSRFYTPVAPGRLEGLVASDGSNHRIAIYWIEPDVFREAASPGFDGVDRSVRLGHRESHKDRG